MTVPACTRSPHGHILQCCTICKATDRKDKSKLSNDIMSNFNIINSRSLKHGRLYERVAIEQFENMYDIKVNRCGLSVSEDRPYLAATPDGIISNDRIIEVKCPYASCNKPINELNVPYLFRNPDDGNLNLKHSHDYYYQV